MNMTYEVVQFTRAISLDNTEREVEGYGVAIKENGKYKSFLSRNGETYIVPTSEEADNAGKEFVSVFGKEEGTCSI